MTKFKVGDRVVVVKNLCSYPGDTYIGCMGTVTHIVDNRDNLNVRVWIDGRREKATGFMEDELEFEDDNYKGGRHEKDCA